MRSSCSAGWSARIPTLDGPVTKKQTLDHRTIALHIILQIFFPQDRPGGDQARAAH